MRFGLTLATSAVIGILAGCGGETPAAQAPATDTSAEGGAKSSCGGAGHTDKNHCSGGAAASPAPAATAPASSAPAAK
jgi:hypothetical protein